LLNGKEKLKKNSVESWTLDEEEFLVDDPAKEESFEDEDDIDDDVDQKIPKKTEIFEGQVVQVDGMLSQRAVSKKPTGRTRLLKAEIRRDKQRL